MAVLPANTMQLLLVVMLPLTSLQFSPAVVAAASDSASALSGYRKRTCRFGINSHHCHLARLDRVMQGIEYLSSGDSPGKRDVELPDDVRSQAEMLLQNLSEQKQAVRALHSLFSKLGARVEQQAKRTCAFRLGNHCLTEALDNAANQYYYLQSPASPGRRRRQAENQEDSLRLRRRADKLQGGQADAQLQQEQQQAQQQRRR